jgi:hypothetical protein
VFIQNFIIEPTGDTYFTRFLAACDKNFVKLCDELVKKIGIAAAFRKA